MAYDLHLAAVNIELAGFCGRFGDDLAAFVHIKPGIRIGVGGGVRRTVVVCLWRHRVIRLGFGHAGLVWLRGTNNSAGFIHCHFFY